MDGLSVAASIIAVWQLTSQVITYLNDVKDAPREWQKCMVEVSESNALLSKLNLRLSESSSKELWYAEVQALAVKDGPLDQYKLALERLLAKVKPKNKTRELANVLKWNFVKEEVASILARTERLKTLVHIALEMDHFKLSQAIRDDTLSIRNALSPLQASTSAIRDAQSLQQHHTIMEWLSPTDFPAQQQDIIRRRQEGTGQWFLDSPKFKAWLQGSDKTLFCPGIPGAGKTMMAAIAIDHLCRTTPCDDIGVAYLFCSYKAQTNQSVSSLLAALLKQLVQNRPDVAAPVTHIYHVKSGNKPSLDDIFGALQSVCSNHATVYIVVDALDECADNDGARSRLIDRLRELQARTDVRLLVTSRRIPEISQKFQSNPMLEVLASEEDVRCFVAGQMSRLPNRIQRDDELKQVIQNKIVEAVEGMFLLARLHVDSLRDKRTKRDVLSTLETLPKGLVALDEAYDKATERIHGQLPEDRSLAWRALSWITYAKRLLTTTELCCALAIRPGDKLLDDDDVYDVEDIISVCAELVTVDEESNVIRLVHYTTQKYFEHELLKRNPSAHEEMAVACLTYLSFDTFRSGSCTSDKAFEQRLAENAFFDYSACYWSEHTRPVENATSCLALAFLCEKALVDCATQIMSKTEYKYGGYSRFFPNQTSGLHLTAMHGLHYFTKGLLMGKHGDRDIRADSKDSYGRTPLSRAATSGHEAVVKLLLDTGKVDADSKDNDGRTPLWWAATNGHEAVVKLLLDTGKVDADSKDYGDRTPLSWAAAIGHEAVMKLLLDTGKVDADSKDTDGRTLLSWAATDGHEAVVKLLLDTGEVDADSKDSYGRTPLWWAAANGHEAVVKLLLDTGEVDADSKDSYGRTPLWWAAANGHEAVVKLLQLHSL